ncbi:MAG: 7-cyano-7-deazaguanine synthase QueC [Hyphomonas sp.]
MALPTSSALVLFSGGQDSATCLAWALERYEHVETIGFDYGQRHAVELECRPRFLSAVRAGFPHWDARLGLDHLIDATVLKSLGQTAMTHDVEIRMTAAGLPNTFVPGRNLLFLTLAGALAARRGIGTIVGGMCETDYSGYPDCRLDTIRAQQETLRLGLDTEIRIETPLMYLDKAASWERAGELGGEALVELILEETHTCYMGDRSQRHPWGYGCGTCPACELRAGGWQRWRDAMA